jgi:hypothetical protein
LRIEKDGKTRKEIINPSKENECVRHSRVIILGTYDQMNEGKEQTGEINHRPTERQKRDVKERKRGAEKMKVCSSISSKRSPNDPPSHHRNRAML